MKKIYFGNLDDRIKLSPETRGWFLGPFMEKFPDFQSQKVELKWIKQEKGFIKPGLSSEKHFKTYAILISGKVLIRFEKEEVLLEKQGDYMYFDTSFSDHSSEFLEDTVMIAIRWEEE